jgi:hypothetical protein
MGLNSRAKGQDMRISSQVRPPAVEYAQVALPQLFFVDVVVDIDGLATRISPELLHEIP